MDLTIDFTGDFVRRITGSASGTGTTADGDDDAFLTSGDVSLAGTAEFAVTRYERDIEAMTDAQLDGYAFTVDGPAADRRGYRPHLSGHALPSCHRSG